MHHLLEFALGILRVFFFAGKFEVAASCGDGDVGEGFAQKVQFDVVLAVQFDGVNAFDGKNDFAQIQLLLVGRCLELVCVLASGEKTPLF